MGRESPTLAADAARALGGAARVAQAALGGRREGAARAPAAAAAAAALRALLAGAASALGPPSAPRPPPALRAPCDGGDRPAERASRRGQPPPPERPSAEGAEGGATRPPANVPSSRGDNSGDTLVIPASVPASASASASTSDGDERSRPTKSSSAGAAAGHGAAPATGFAPREARVPSTQIGRALGFARLGLGLMGTVAAHTATRAWNGPSDEERAAAEAQSAATSPPPPPLIDSAYLSEASAEALAAGLCRMRGSALKLGQMLSMQGDEVLPPQVARALARVRAGADTMPAHQLRAQLDAQLGEDWQERLVDFQDKPMAAASIGQVHRARLPPPLAERYGFEDVALKVQYPGVAESIDSDVDNLLRLVRMAAVLPKGLYVEDAVTVAKRELREECDYTRELSYQLKFREMLAARPVSGVSVPAAVPELSAGQVIATQLVPGVALDRVAELPRATRDRVGERILELALASLFELRTLQSDPNWGNFLYDDESDTLHMIDFGASKEYDQTFVEDYLRMVYACAERDADAVRELSISLGFLTGDESAAMIRTHCEAGFVVGEPFAHEGIYDFGSSDRMTTRVASLGKGMLEHRLTPPPEAAYSLHRSLSGAFLACMKLGARVPARRMLLDTYERVLGGDGNRLRATA